MTEMENEKTEEVPPLQPDRGPAEPGGGGEGTQEEEAGQAEALHAASHLDEELEGSEEAGAGGEVGVEEALQAWAAGGHAEEEQDEGEEVALVRFQQLDPQAPVVKKPHPKRLNNVYVDISVELGRVEKSVGELMNMKEADLIELDKLAGEAFQIRVNERLFAEGEIVVVTDQMAVRITRLFGPFGAEGEEFR